MIASADRRGILSVAVRWGVVLLVVAAGALLLEAAEADAYVYWGVLNGSVAGIGRATLAGTGVNQAFFDSPYNTPVGGLAESGGHLYFGSGEEIGIVNLDGTEAPGGILASGAVDGVAADSTYVYWANEEDDEIGRARQRHRSRRRIHHHGCQHAG